MAAPSPERWSEIEPVLDRLLEFAPEQRREVLAATCSGDPALHDDVERVLQAAERAEAFLGDSAAAYASSLLVRVSRYRLLAPGQRIGPYLIERELGQGGMATVYLARDTKHNRVVALKVLRPELSATLGVERFVRETAIAARLNHPHILPLFDSGSFNDGSGDPLLYFGMPYVEGRSLRDYLRETSPLPVASAVAIARQVAEALDHAHKHGIVHRDIKPENVLLAGEHAFVADFGIALALDVGGTDRLTNTGLVVGTPAYMSPEQATTDRLDGRSDLYSLGCMLYEMLAGDPPFIGSTARAVLAQHGTATVPSLRARRPSVPAALERVIVRSLEKTPEDRFPNARGFADALAAAPTTPSWRDRVALSRRGRHMLVALGLFALTALGTLVPYFRARGVPPKGSAVSRTTVAVLPFVYGGSQEFAYLGESMVDLLSIDLNGAGEVHAVAPNAALVQLGRSHPDSLIPSQARGMAARLGAGSYIRGSVVETDGHLRISARVQSGESTNGREPVVVSGPASQLQHLVDTLSARLIAQVTGGSVTAVPRLARLTTDSSTALRAYLDGERYLRAGEIDSSLQALTLAVRIDSSFALADYHRASVALLTGPPSLPIEAADRALRHSSRLGHTDRQLVEAMVAALHNRLAEAERMYRTILSAHPENFEAAAYLGQLIIHSGDVGDRRLRRSWLDAREWFERALAIDPTYGAALAPLTDIAARERRLGELDSLTNRMLRIDPHSRTSPWFRWYLQGQRDIAFGDTAGIERFVAAIRNSPDEARPFAAYAVYTTGDLQAGRTIWRLFTEPPHSRGVRVLSYLTLAKMEVMSGRWSAAKVELDSAAALDPATALEHRVLLALWPLLRVPRPELVALRDSLLRWKAVPGPPNQTSVSGDHASAHPYLRPYLLGLLDVRLGDYPDARTRAEELARRAGTSYAPAFVGDLGRAVRAEVARAQGRPGEALQILENLEFWSHSDLDAQGDSPFFTREREQFTRAELLHALGRDTEAIEVYRALADDLFHSGAPAHFRLAEIYRQGGDRVQSAAHYAKFAELWKDCDPELRPLVVEAQREMALR
jgi:tetratricopeptide (TPR) repeat protein/TolB-like protein